MLDQFSYTFEILRYLFTLVSPVFALWWIFGPLLLYLAAYNSFRNYVQLRYILSVKWVLLEIKVPKNPNRSPKATEQIFANLHGTAIPVKKLDRFLKGKIPDWFSFEIVSDQGYIRFFVRTPEHFRSLVQAQVYAQYPDAEIYEVEDYVNILPTRLPNDKYDIWGTGLTLSKEDAYPIRTYLEFEEKAMGNMGELRRVDPFASLSEVLSSLHADEHIWIQMLVRPTNDAWMKRAQSLINKLLGKEDKKAPSGFLESFSNFFDGILPGGATVKEEKKEEKRPDIAPGAAEAVRAIQESTNKLGHETTMRFMYIAPKESFHRAHISGLIGFYKQFSTQNLNGFTLDKYSITAAQGLFKKSKELRRKIKLFKNYRLRAFSQKPYVLNTEELATVFHFPDIAVRSPLLPRVEAKKGEPPSGLPTI